VLLAALVPTVLIDIVKVVRGRSVRRSA
jgi:hypothetical protein